MDISLLKEQATTLLDQLSAFIQSLGKERYVKPLAFFQGATLGQHVRHSISFYVCLLEGISSAEGTVNYDARERDERLETLPHVAIDAIKRIQGEFMLLLQAPDRAIRLVVQKEAKILYLPTFVYRECAYAIDHLVHHMAMLRMGVEQVVPEVVLPEDFGVAHSTMTHRKEQKKEAMAH